MEEQILNTFIDSFNKLYDDFETILKQNFEKINNDNKLKIICAYCGILFGYSKEISILLSTKWYTSITPLTRDLLECYAIIKKMVLCFQTDPDFYDFYHYLIFTDINQDKTIYTQLKTDTTITDTVSRDAELINFQNRFKSLIQTYFPSYSGQIDDNNLESSLFITIANMKRVYDRDRANYPSKNIFVGEMLIQNNTWKRANHGLPYPKSYAIYSTLCHSTHNNISSVEERTIDNGYFKLNNKSTHIKSVLSLAYYCTLETFEDLQSVLA